MPTDEALRKRNTLRRETIKKLNTQGDIIELGESTLISEEDLFI